MEITLTVNGKQVKATVDEQEMKEAMGEKKVKRTGYESQEQAYAVTENGDVTEVYCNGRPLQYQAGNIYSDKWVAESNARADALMRKLRRFAAEHGGCVNAIRNKPDCYYHITWNVFAQEPEWTGCASQHAGAIAFVSKKQANAAIKEFHDDLKWYFTEYDPMPGGWWDET